MKFHYNGKYNLDEDSLPHGKHMEGAVMFKEVQDIHKLSKIANIIAIIIMIVLAVFAVFRCGFDYDYGELVIVCLLMYPTLFVHELLHAICFKEDVYMYTAFKQGLLFVVGPETMSKSRFVFMSLLPNIVLGCLPYIMGLYLCRYSLAFFGAMMIAGGAGDYYNVYNALTQMPKGAKTYMYKMHSYWYLPKGSSLE